MNYKNISTCAQHISKHIKMRRYGDKAMRVQRSSLELWCSWLSHLLYTQKALGSNPSSSTFY